MLPIRLGVVGVGAIARNHHIPSIRANACYHLAAASDSHGQIPGVANFQSIGEMLAQVANLEAVPICTPPKFHYEAAKLALIHGKHVLLEKPPCTSLQQLAHLEALAAFHSVTLYQAWHSQLARGVAPALRLLRQRKLTGVRATWKEDVRVWHPGNTWIWQAGGFGVFDGGVNALSILTLLIEEPIFPCEATLYVPANCQAPIAAAVVLRTDSGIEIGLELDFRHTGIQTWNIDINTDDGQLQLVSGGSELSVDHVQVIADEGKLASEYAAIYRRFAELVAHKSSEVDARPMQLLADIFLIAERVVVEPFAM